MRKTLLSLFGQRTARPTLVRPRRLLVLLLLLLGTVPALAQTAGIFEGYAIVSGGSNNRFFDLNPSTATANPDFGGGSIGAFYTTGVLRLGGQLKTFKNTGDNVTSVRLNYRVYSTGAPSGAYTAISLPFDINLPSAGDQQWTQFANVGAATISLSGLAAGSYTVEVYGDATTANSGTQFYSNGGANFKATFTILAAPASLCGTSYTIDNTINASATNFASFTSAFAALNAYTVSCATSFGVPSGATYAETPPTLGSTTLNASLASTTLTFVKTGATANPRITAGVGASPTVDAIIGLSGVDNTTFDGIDVVENAANITATTQMEFGYALFRASATDGCQNNTIRNCFVGLNKTNTATIGIAGLPNASTSGTTILATSTAGANSNNVVTGTVVSNALKGIDFSAATTITIIANYDQNNRIGVTALNAAAGNTIGNFGGVGTSGWGAGGAYQNGLRVGNNTLNSTRDFTSTNTASFTAVLASTVTFTLRGIFCNTGTSSNVDVTSNNITLASGATVSLMSGIENSMGSTAAGNTVNITGNTVTNCTYATATSGSFTGISNSASAATVNINTNTVTSNSLPGTGQMTLITGGSPTTLNINTNTVTGNAKTGTIASGTMYCIQASTAVVTLTNNTISANSIAATGTSPGTLYGYYNVGSPTAETVTNNTVTNLSIAGASTSTAHTVNGLRFNTIAADVMAITLNTIGTLAIGGSGSGTVTGMQFSTGGGTGSSISRNKIYDLSATGTAGFVNGLTIAGGGTYLVSNNLIGDLRAPAAIGLLAIAGLNITSGTQINAYHNTIYLNATGGATFGTSGISFPSGTTTNLDLRGNLVVNTSTAAGAGGYTAALRRGSGATGTSPANLLATSDYNLFNVGTATATNLLYVEGSAAATNPIQTLMAYKALMGAPKEANAKTEITAPATLFLSLAGANANFLHLNDTNPTRAESGGVTTPVVAVDFDNQARGPYPITSPVQANGGGTASDIGGDEGDFTPVPGVDVGISALTAPASSQTCFGTTETVTVTLKNFAATTINFVTTLVTVSGSVVGPGSTTTTLTSVVVNTGTLAGGGTQPVTFATTVDMSATGTYTFNITATVTGDTDATNNALPGTPAGTNTRTVQPLAVGTASASPATGCGPTTVTLTSVGSTGGTITWYSSADGYATAIGTGSPFTTAAAISATTSFQSKTICGASSTAFSNTATVTVTNPTVTGTNTPVTRCGPGNVTLTATSTSGSTPQYYTASTGGTAFASGASATVSVTGNTTYYVGAKDNGTSTETVGRTTFVTQSGTTPSNYGLVFTSTSAITLTSVDVFRNSASAGTVTVQLQDNAGVLIPGQTYTGTVPAGTIGTAFTLPLNFSVPQGTGLRLIATTGTADLERESSIGGFPYNSTGGTVSITSGYIGGTSTTYYYFYNWQLLKSCEPTARTPIAVNVTTPPVLSPATTTQTVCANSTTTIAFSGGTYNSLTVSPSAGTVVTGMSVDFTPTTTTTYTVTASDPSGCQATATVTLNATPLAAGTAAATPGSFCGVASGTPSLSLTGTAGALGGFVWQSSASAGGPFMPLAGSANQNPFVAPTITATTYYQAVATCGSSTATSNVVTVTVSNPSVTATNSPQARCGTGSVTLTATPSTGATINWYDTNVSTVILAAGNSYSPTVTATRQFFAAAAVPNAGTETVGRTAPTTIDGLAPNSYGLVFNAASAFTLTSVDVYRFTAGGGTLTVQLQTSAGVLIPGQAVTLTVPASTVGSVYTAPLNFAVPAGTAMRLLATAGTASLVREFSGFSPAFPFNSPSGNVSITGGYISGASTVYYYFYNWQVTGPCVSARTPVQVNVSTPPTLSPATTSATICNGSSTSVTYTGYANLTVSPTTGATVSGTTVTFAPTTVGVSNYTITGNDGTGAAGCTNTATATITVKPVPNAPTLTPTSPAAYCAGGNTVVAASSNTNALTNQTVLATADFDSGANSFTVVTGTSNTSGAEFTRVTAPYTNSTGPGSYNGPSGASTGGFFIANSNTSGTTSNSQLTSPAFSTVNYTAATLSFQQYYLKYTTGDIAAALEYSTNGTAWTLLVDYLTAGSQGTSTGAQTPTTVTLPAGALGQATVQVRFRYQSAFGFYWAIDNVGVTGTRTESATFAVTGGTGASVSGNNITFNPTTTTTYNVTASYPSASCPSVATPITITVNPLPTFSTAQTNVACFGGSTGSITVTAAGGTGTYEYSNNGGGSYQASNVFSGLAAGTYQVQVRNLGGAQCAAPAQPVTIAQPASALAVAATATAETAAGANDGTVTAAGSGGTSPYEYSLNGGAFQASTVFSGLAPATYTVMARDANACTATTTVVVNAGAAPCTSTTYTGAAPGDGTNWFNPGNWTACVPTRTVDATIPGGLANYPNLSAAATAEVRTLTLDNGAGLTQSAGTLDVYANLTSNTPAANVSLTGSAVQFVGTARQALGGAQPLSFFNLTVSKSDTLHVDTDQTVRGTLALTAGILKTYVLTNTRKITLTGAGTLTETATSFVLGDVEAAAALNTDGSSSPFGGTGLTLTAQALKPDGAPASLPGATTVLRSTGTPVYGVTPAGGPQSRSIRRRYTITAASETNLSVDMAFGYNDSAFELNGIAETSLRLFSAPTLAGPFRSEGGTPSIAANTVTRTGLDHLSVWTLGNAAAPLPVELTRFEAVREGADAALSWATASEKNNRGFEVQVSPDGRSYRALAFVAGAGSSSAPRAYAFRDREAGKTGPRYYRLRQLDFDGTASFSPVRALAFGEAPGNSLSAAPNPFDGELTLHVQARTAQSGAVLTLFDAAGRPVARRVLDVPAGRSQLPVAGLEGLAAGLYVGQLTLDGQALHLKVVKR